MERVLEPGIDSDDDFVVGVTTDAGPPKKKRKTVTEGAGRKKAIPWTEGSFPFIAGTSRIAG